MFNRRPAAPLKLTENDFYPIDHNITECFECLCKRNIIATYNILYRKHVVVHLGDAY